MGDDVTGEERAGWDLTEAESREIITKQLELVYTQRKTDFLELVALAGHVWIMFIFSAIGSILLHHQVPVLPIIEACLAFTVFTAVLYKVVSILLKRYRKHLVNTVSTLSDQERDLLIPRLNSSFERITHFAPKLLRVDLPPANHKLTLNEQVDLVAKNLDWYLAEPRRLIRIAWVDLYVLLLIVLIIGGFCCTVQPGGGTLFLNLAGLVIWLWATVLHYTLLKPIGKRCEAIRIEIYRDFVLDWYERHPLEDDGD